MSELQEITDSILAIISAERFESIKTTCLEKLTNDKSLIIEFALLHNIPILETKMKQVTYYEFNPQVQNSFIGDGTNYLKGRKYVIDRFIKVEPFTLDRCYGVSFHVMEKFDYSIVGTVYIPGIEKPLKSWNMFDRDFPKEASLLFAINSNDLRGKFATDSVYHLFMAFFEGDKLDELKEFFPEYVAMRYQADYDSLEKEIK